MIVIMMINENKQPNKTNIYKEGKHTSCCKTNALVSFFKIVVSTVHSPKRFLFTFYIFVTLLINVS